MDSHFQSARRSFGLVQHALHQIKGHPSPYLSDKDMKHLGIRCTGLDLDTGKPTDGGVAFISPYPLTEIDRILQENEPWEEYQLSEEKDSMNMCAAMQISSLLGTYLCMGKNEDVEGLIRQTKWEMRCQDVENCEVLHSRDDEQAKWEVTYLFDQLDPSTSHISCFLANDAPLRDDRLSVSEMWCVLAITAGRLRQREYRIHRLFPVTVISASSRKLRIVQAYIDNQQGCVWARKSQIVDFEKEDLRTTELILSWAMGNPVGNTRHKTS